MSYPSAPAAILQIDAAFLATAMGDDTATTMAALVARRQMFRQHLLDGHKLITAPAVDIAAHSSGVQRLHALLQAVAQPALAAQPTTSAHPPRIALILPGWVAEHDAQALARSVHATLYRQGGATTCYRALTELWPQDTATPLLLLAVDSLCEAATMQRDHAQGLVHYAGKEVKGWIAGEAAAAVLLKPLARVAQLQSRRLGLYRPSATAAGTVPRWPSATQGDGRALGKALQAALQASDMALHHISHGTGDFDGATWRAEDRDIALGRLAQESGQAWDGRMLAPAEWLGQLGAAWGAVQWAIAAQLLQLDIEPLNTVLSCVQETSGACAAVVLERSAR